MNKICKKIILAVGAVALMVTPVIASVPTNAKPEFNMVVVEDGGGGGGSTVKHDKERTFLGMKPWYYSLTKTSGDLKCIDDDGQTGGCVSLSAFIWTAVANVASDLAILAAYLAVGFVIYGGYQYMFAGGEAAKIQSGKKMITNASIGLVIVIMANVIFNTIRVVLSGGAGNTIEVDGATLVQADAMTEVADMISWVVGVAGIVALGFVVLGAVSYMTANGDPGKLTKAKNTILYALVGLLIVGLAEAIVAFVAGTARSSIETNNGDDNTSSIQMVIAKELNEKTLG